MKYGMDSFNFHILAVLNDETEASRIEQVAIKSFGTLSPNGYNLRAGAPYTLYAGEQSEETRANHSAAHFASPKAQKQLAELQAAHIGIPLSPEHRQKISSTLKGITLSLETRQKMSMTRKGKPRLPETCQKISNGMKKVWAFRKEKKVRCDPN
jgi:hypothetical protein